MPLRRELDTRLHDMLALELNLRAYLREWQTHVRDAALRLRLEEAVSSIGPEADGVAKCLFALGRQPTLAGESPILEVFRQQDSQRRAESPAENDIRCAVSVLALGQLKAGLYRSLIALAAALPNPGVEHTLRELLAYVHHDLSRLQEAFAALLPRASEEIRREAA